MSRVKAAIADLRDLAHELEARGDAQLARRVERAITILQNDREPGEHELMTTGAAAQALGIRSVNTIKRWASQGLLEGVRRGGRVLVTHASVEKLKGHTSLDRQAAFERELDAALDPFDAGDEPIPDVSMTWTGRKPWEQRAGTGSRSSAHAEDSAARRGR